MHCCDTGSMPAVRLPNLDVKTASRLDKLIGTLKRAPILGNAWLLLTLSGGHVDDIKPLKPLNLPPTAE